MNNQLIRSSVLLFLILVVVADNFRTFLLSQQEGSPTEKDSKELIRMD